MTTIPVTMLSTNPMLSSEEILAGDGASQRVACELEESASPDEPLALDVAIRLELLEQGPRLASQCVDMQHERFLLDGA